MIKGGVHDHVRSIHSDQLHIPEQSAMILPDQKMCGCFKGTFVRHQRFKRTLISIIRRSSMCMYRVRAPTATRLHSAIASASRSPTPRQGIETLQG